MEVDIQILNTTLDKEACINWCITPDCGGINVFIGTVRNQTRDREVVKLQFEAYEKMAISEMNKIAANALDNWPIKRLLIHHRVGELTVGEVPIIIVVAAAHRDAAFEACRYVIDNLKQTVPIWKKEFFVDGEVWVSATP